VKPDRAVFLGRVLPIQNHALDGPERGLMQAPKLGTAEAEASAYVCRVEPVAVEKGLSVLETQSILKQRRFLASVLNIFPEQASDAPRPRRSPFDRHRR
jgi:hypothetical protein